jgi:superfamily I DNA/RNA helicase
MSARWTAADAVLLDEVSALLERGATYGHVIVDEAQDLSPMQCRAIARRSEHGSITVLGDLAQGTTTWAAADWETQLTYLGKRSADVVALTTGYRVPAAVVEIANRLLKPLGVSVPPTTSLRSDGQLTITRVDDLPSACVTAVQAALEYDGSIGVITADDHSATLADALKAAGIESVPPDGDGRGVQLISAYAATSRLGSGASRIVGLASASRTTKRSRSARVFLSSFIVSRSCGQASAR